MRRGAGRIRTGDGGFAIIRQGPQNPRETGILENAGANAGALETKLRHIDADLQAVIDAWPDLPEAVKSDIVAMVEPRG